MHDGLDPLTAFTIPLDESYNHFFFDVPWPANRVATRFGVVVDNEDVAPHAWLFSSLEDQPHGTVQRDVTGTFEGYGGHLIAPWSLGGCAAEMPEDVGLQLPAANGDRKLVVQWHHENQSGSPIEDASKMVVCTVPAAQRTHVASYTALGSELGPLGIPEGLHYYVERCENDSTSAISLLSVAPHMHRIGSYAEAVVERLGGGDEVLHAQGFAFGMFEHYATSATLQPGDTLRFGCTFYNPSSTPVTWGQSTRSELCFVFALSYPAGALDDPSNANMFGLDNTCWGD